MEYLETALAFTTSLYFILYIWHECDIYNKIHSSLTEISPDKWLFICSLNCYVLSSIRFIILNFKGLYL